MEDDLAIGALNGQQPQQQEKPAQAQPQSEAMKFGPLGKGLEQWMKDAYTLGMTGGDAVRSGLTASYNQFSDMMQSVMSQDYEGAKRARQEWRAMTEGTLEFNKQRLSEYMEIWGGKGGMDDKMGQLQDVAVGHYGDRLIGDLAQANNITAIGRYLDMLMEQQQKAETATKALESQFTTIEARMPTVNQRLQ